jgi:cell division protein FtsW
MGQKTTVNKWVGAKSPKIKSAQTSTRLNVDVPLVLVTTTLVVFGLVMVYSASYGVSGYESPGQMFLRQLSWLGVGLVIMSGFIVLDYRKWKKVTVPVMILTILMLVGVLMFGETSEGYSRNLSGGSYQPSELAKLMTVVYLAVWMYSKQETLSDLYFGIIPLAAILGILAGLILMQPDLSAAATVIILGVIMFIIAGGSYKQFFIMLCVTVLAGFFVVKVFSYGSTRFEEFFSGLKDPLASSDHVQRALSAFANGGWFGVGIGQGTIKLTILPVPHTDSIFAVVGEEFGVVGCTLIVILFGIFLWRGLVIARNAPDGLGTLLAAGIAIWITLEAYFNMLALTGMMPFAGNALPFFSIGGSSLVFTLFGVGVLLNISRQSGQKQMDEERRTFGALIDLRGRNGGGRVSRANRTRSIKRRTS